MEIVEKLGSELLFVLLSERDPEILMRTLGLLRNLLSKKQVSVGDLHFQGFNLMRKRKWLVFERKVG